MLKPETNAKKGSGEAFSGKLSHCITDWRGTRYRDRGPGLLLPAPETVRYSYFPWDWAIAPSLESDVCQGMGLYHRTFIYIWPFDSASRDQKHGQLLKQFRIHEIKTCVTPRYFIQKCECFLWLVVRLAHISCCDNICSVSFWNFNSQSLIEVNAWHKMQ